MRSCTSSIPKLLGPLYEGKSNENWRARRCVPAGRTEASTGRCENHTRCRRCRRQGWRAEQHKVFWIVCGMPRAVRSLSTHV